MLKNTDKLNKLAIDFYNRKDVVKIAKELIGKILVTKFDEKITSGRIVETEAYFGITDKASHSFGGRRTLRNEPMYSDAGTVYVYVCYGMHHMLNVVTNKKDTPDAILVRAVEPIAGIRTMMKRTGKKISDNTITKGPGNVAKALGINKAHSGRSFLSDDIFFASDDDPIDPGDIGISKRIGVDYAETDSLLPYRFYIKGNKFVSGRPSK